MSYLSIRRPFWGASFRISPTLSRLLRFRRAFATKRYGFLVDVPTPSTARYAHAVAHAGDSALRRTAQRGIVYRIATKKM